MTPGRSLSVPAFPFDSLDKQSSQAADTSTKRLLQKGFSILRGNVPEKGKSIDKNPGYINSI